MSEIAYLAECAKRAQALLSADDIVIKLGREGVFLLPENDDGESLLERLIADWRRIHRDAPEAAR